MENMENDEKHVEDQCHGNHWDCVLSEKTEFKKLLSDSLEKSHLYGQLETDYVLTSKIRGTVSMLEYDCKKSDPIVIRNVIVENEEKQNELASGYPVVRKGNLLSVKITKIIEWESGLEAWITGELENECEITFFDADYAINKDKYNVGKSYNFVVGALSYYAEESESKGFKFEGQKAIDFKAKIGEEVEYDEDGNVKPVEFSTEKLCAFFQTGPSPDDAEYISTVKAVKSVESLEKSFWSFEIIFRGVEEKEIFIPTFVRKTSENKNLNKAPQIQGVLWVTGYLV